MSKDWKPVELPASLITGPHANELIGIEELNDYEIERKTGTEEKKQRKRKVVNKSNSKSAKSKTMKKRKKNTFIVEDTNENKSTEDTDPMDTDFIPWDNICVPRDISRALIQQGFTQPTEIQAKCIPAAIKGRRDLLGAAQTGSGKTLAFGIPIIYGITKSLNLTEENSNNEMNSTEETVPQHQTPQEKLWSLVLTPTRELAIQIKNQLELAAKYTPIKIVVIVGGLSNEKQERLLNGKPHIVVATPGRLWDLLSHPHFSNVETIRFLAIDETDRMLEQGHFAELRSLLEKINVDTEAKKNRQNFVFSATLSFVHDPPKRLKKKNKKAVKLTSLQKLKNIMNDLGITNPKIVDITPTTGTAEELTECKLTCSLEKKDIYLYYFLLQYSGKTLVFCNTISCVRRLTSLFHLLNLKPLPIHAEMRQSQRLKNLDRFRENPKGLLLATDVAARGLDIQNVQHVIHFQVPRTFESYVHRSGRTARAKKGGLSLLLIDPAEIKLYTKLCSSLNRSTDIPDFVLEEDLIKKPKEIIECAREIDKLQHKVKNVELNSRWMEDTANKLDIILDDKICEKPNTEAVTKIKSRIKNRRTVLNQLLKSLVHHTSGEETSAIKKVDSHGLKPGIRVFKRK